MTTAVDLLLIAAGFLALFVAIEVIDRTINTGHDRREWWRTWTRG